MKRKRIAILALTAMVAMAGCGNKKNTTEKTDAAETEAVTVKAPVFNADSAYQFVKAQVDFGPRVPNTEEHKRCRAYLIEKLKEYGATVYTQDLQLPTYTGKLLDATNIIGEFQPEKKIRVALFSHWDSRPWADQDPDPKNHYKPILGANDGASGVGVLLELARIMQEQKPEVGVDIVFLDAEDYGNHSDYTGEHSEESWGLGAQAWARVPHKENYHARFGILLDMVGGKNPEFRYEALSQREHGNINKKVWKEAKRLGYGRMFIPEVGGEITDDHVFINRYASVPTIDIVPYNFFPDWHTLKDDMSAIDKNTLKAVGQTITNVIYNEK